MLKYVPDDKKVSKEERYADVKAIVQEVARQKAELFERTDDLVINLTEFQIKINIMNIKKIIEEIVDNAFKFSKPKSPVEISASEQDKVFCLAIKDHGLGMTPESIEQIGAYIQFERDAHEQQGSGLGLVIAKLLTQVEGGTFDIESSVSQGTKITLKFSKD